MWRRRRRWCVGTPGALLAARSCRHSALTATQTGRLTWFQIRRMDLEARSLPVGVKTPLLNTLRDYKVRVGWLALLAPPRAQRH
jgi:hypothetical protein